MESIGMSVVEALISGIIGSILGALIVGFLSHITTKYQIKNLKEDFQDQIKAYENNTEKLIQSFKDNIKLMLEVTGTQEHRIISLEDKLVEMIQVSKNVNERKLNLQEREIARKERNENLRNLKKIGEFFGII